MDYLLKKDFSVFFFIHALKNGKHESLNVYAKCVSNEVSFLCKIAFTVLSFMFVGLWRVFSGSVSCLMVLSGRRKC